MLSRIKSVIVPVIIITIGVGTLLTVHNVIPGVNWVWTLGLGVAGVGVLSSGIDKLTMLVGPFLLSSMFFSLLRQTDCISFDTEVPCLIIAFGVFLLMVKVLPIPVPNWAAKLQKDEQKKEDALKG
jgi:hypothetical protein